MSGVQESPGLYTNNHIWRAAIGDPLRKVQSYLQLSGEADLYQKKNSKALQGHLLHLWHFLPYYGTGNIYLALPGLE